MRPISSYFLKPTVEEDVSLRVFPGSKEKLEEKESVIKRGKS